MLLRRRISERQALAERRWPVACGRCGGWASPRRYGQLSEAPPIDWDDKQRRRSSFRICRGLLPPPYGYLTDRTCFGGKEAGWQGAPRSGRSLSESAWLAHFAGVLRFAVASPTAAADEAVPVSQRPPALEALTARWHIADDDARRNAVPVITATSRWWRCRGGQVSRTAMETGAFVTALTLCLALLWESGEAIKCWECNSHADPRCADPFDNTSLPIGECAARNLPHYPNLKATMCRKIRQKVNGNWRFIRSCAFLGQPGEGTNDENYCLMRTGTYDVFVETCTCKSKDGCNTASQQSGPLLLLALGAAAATGVVLGTLR